MKSNKIPYIIYGDIKSLIRKLDGCTNDMESIFFVDIQCQQLEDLITQKTKVLRIVEKIV